MVQVTLTDAEAQTLLQALTADQQRTRHLVATMKRHNANYDHLLVHHIARLDDVADKLIEAGTWDFGREALTR